MSSSSFSGDDATFTVTQPPAAPAGPEPAVTNAPASRLTASIVVIVLANLLPRLIPSRLIPSFPLSAPTAPGRSGHASGAARYVRRCSSAQASSSDLSPGLEQRLERAGRREVRAGRQDRGAAHTLGPGLAVDPPSGSGEGCPSIIAGEEVAQVVTP